MRWRRLFLTLGLLSLVEGRKHYAEILQDPRIEDIFRLLQTRDLLKGNYSGTSDECARDLTVYVGGVESKESWALKMLDASSRVPTGLREGNIIDLGNFDECVESESMRARHCMYAVDPKIEGNILPFHPTMSICLPDSCGSNDVVAMVNGAINATDRLRSFGARLASANCTSNDVPIIDTGVVIWGTFMTAYVGFLVLCTVLDFTESNDEHKSDKYHILAKFSLWKNAKKLFSTKVQDNSLPFLHGMRVLSTAWIVLFHEYFFQFFMVNANLVYIPEWFSSWRFLGPSMANLSVDTFFTISGFLMTYTFIKKMKKGEKFHIIHYYLHRYIRLTLPMAMVIIGTMIVFPKITTGPRWEWFLDFGVNGVRSTWWSSLLYIQNFVNRNDFRLLHLWSLCVDMQLFWISPIILFPLYKKPKLGLTVLTLLLVACLITTAFIVGINEYPTAYVTYNDLDINFGIDAVKDVYMAPYTRASPWLLGIYLGYIVTRDSSFKINKKYVFIGWLSTFVSLFIMFFGLSFITSKDYQFKYIQDVTFTTFVRPVWSLMTCWVIYACINNVAGPISTILSWRVFLPLSRISYCVYLVHLLFPSLRVGTTRGATYFSDYLIFRDFMGDLIMSVIFGFFYSLLFEVPIIILESILFKKKKEALQVNEKTQL